MSPAFGGNADAVLDLGVHAGRIEIFGHVECLVVDASDAKRALFDRGKLLGLVKGQAEVLASSPSSRV